MKAKWLEKQEEANLNFQKELYGKAAALYEESIDLEPKITSNYWYLGLALLLQGDEEAAQIAWMTPMLEASEEQQEVWTLELVEILRTEAQHQKNKQNFLRAWSLRQHIREIAPYDVDNAIELLHLVLDIDKATFPENYVLQINEILQQKTEVLQEKTSLLELLRYLIQQFPHQESVLQLIETSIPYLLDRKSEIVDFLLSQALVLHHQGYSQKAISIIKTCMELSPDNLEILRYLIAFLQNSGQFLESVSIADKFLAQANRVEKKLVALYQKIRGFIYTGGTWEQAKQAYYQHQNLLQETIINPEQINIENLMPILVAGVFSPYFEDCPSKYRPIRNSYAKICQEKLQVKYSNYIKNYNDRYVFPNRKERSSTKIKVGYISECFHQHSVSWLSRWTLIHHDRDRFEVHIYSTNPHNKKEDSMRKMLEQICSPYFHDLSLKPGEKSDKTIISSAEKIIEDRIDILIDLDSLTSNLNSAIVALKPAPIQITWLGFDASGFPAIDYFIADPYVLPESASQYYTENIWRLPQTYIAVDGFEVGVPTLRRDSLGIPNDAVVYFSSQSGAKRNPHNVRNQMRILKEVPNSYFLIKGLRTDLNAVKQFFEAIAESEGVDCDRLRFLPNAPLEATHRANLKIADVVLDTYPYNGATTTLETLWMEIPLVTQVGTQFAARNSYSMLKNVGVTEGIAWNAEEYIEWGIRLGKDLPLRQKVVWQLRTAKQTSLLWNAEQFTKNLEQAYEQMWQYYLQGGEIEN